jgi:hypothetical protein
MKSNLSLLAGTLIVLAIFGGVIAWNVSIWRECRADHSWGYCMLLISK